MHKDFVELDIDDVTVRNSIREDTGDIAMLSASISKLGVLMPILVDRNNVIITGARRLAACRDAGIRHIPAFRIDTEFDSMAALDIQVDLNICREPLTSAEVEQLIKKKRLAAGKRDINTKTGVASRIKQWLGND